jgi:hypothetical protein
MKKSLLFFFILPFFQALAQPAIQWQHTIGGDSLDYLYLSEQTRDGGYILGGTSRSNIAGEKSENNIGWFDYWLVKTDSMGVIQWQNTIGGDSDDVLRCVHQTIDGGYILGGYSYSDISGDKTEAAFGGSDYWVVKTDSLGVIQWQKTIGGSLVDNMRSIIQTSDGGYIMGGESNSHPSGNKTVNTHGGNDYWTVKIDSTGNIQWQSSHGGTNEDLQYSIIQTTDGGYLQGGYSRSNANGDKTVGTNGNDDYWLIKTDSAGTIQWQKGYGGNDYDQLQSMQETSDGGFILGGYSQSPVSGDKTQSCRGWYDYWVIKTNNAGTIQWQNTIGGDSVDYLYSIRQTSDHGYIMGGSSASHLSGDKTTNSYGGSDYWVVRIDSVGAIQWQKQLGGTLNDIARSVWQTTDGGYLTGGDAYSGISGNKTESSRGFNDYWLVKINHELRLDAVAHSDLLCNGDFSGVASVTATGGAPPYTYLWTPSGQTTATATNLPAGNYTCTVTDGGGGYEVTGVITITQPPLLTATVTSHTDLICNGVNIGNATAVAAGGAGSFSYEWNSVPVQTTDTAQNLAAGNYTITVTDISGCTATDTVTITQPPAINLSIVAHTDVQCHGGNNGNAKAVAFGGTGALTYSWNTIPPQNQPTANALSANTYTVTVNDANGCTATASITITEPPLLVSFISSQTDVSPCAGGNNGNAVVMAGGGTPPYSYTWSTSPSQHSDTATGLSGGTYTVTVRDAHNCINATIAVITEPLPVTTSLVVSSPICGNTNGSVTAIVSNGTLPYTYLWNTGNTTNAVTALTGMPADSLTLIVSDVNHCVDTSTLILSCLQCSLQVVASTPVDTCPSSAVTLSTSAMTEVRSCGLNLPASIAPDGAPCSDPSDTLNCPVSNFSWAYLVSPSCLDPVINCSTIESVYVSLDSITGTPSHGCGNDNVLWLRSPAGTLFLLAGQKPLNANTDNHYKPTFTSSGSLGSIPNAANVSYDGIGYQPDGGSLCTAFFGESLYATNDYATSLGLPAGSWIAYMNDRDSLGCTNVSRITEFCIIFHNASGSVSYAWSSNGGCNAFLSDSTSANPQFTIPSGIYDCTFTVTVSDSCGCSGSDTVRIHCPSPLLSENISAENIFTIQPNPAHNSFTISLNGEWSMVNGQLTIFDATGRLVLEQPIINPKAEIYNSFFPGVYFVKVDHDGAMHTAKLIIE